MPNVILPFRPSGTVSLDVTTATGNVALANGDSTVLVQNIISTEAVLYFKLGDSTVTAAVTDTPLMPGDRLPIRKGTADTHIAAITAAATATLRATSGYGG